MSSQVITAIEIQEHPFARSISDDDSCSDCKHCAYVPGELSLCKQQLKSMDQEFPGKLDENDYVVDCPSHDSLAANESNWAK